MKRNKVKGFTLVELIIVMATFSIIMFGALQLIQPTNKMYTRSYQSEDLSASQKNIKNYLESNLRYAQYMSVQADPFFTPALPMAQMGPQMDRKVTHFVNRHYNGKITKDGAKATGKVYVIQIDNTRGGKVSSWEYSYTAGDIARDVMDTETVDNADSVAGAASVTEVGSQDWAINKASYDNYNYLFSLGVVEKSGVTVGSNAMFVPVVDTEYYDKFSDSNMGTFGAQNFTFTINAYDPDKAQTDSSGGVTTTYYADLFTTTATVSMINCDKQESYFHHDWVNKGTVDAPNWEHKKEADGTETLHYSVNPPGTDCSLGLDLPFTISGFPDASTYVSPDYITLIYSYPSGDYT